MKQAKQIFLELNHSLQEEPDSDRSETKKRKRNSSFGRKGRSFGGSLLKNSHAKSARPLDSKKPTHLVLKSSLAKGRRSFLTRGREVESVVHRHARKHGLRIYEMANGGNHLHIILRTPKRRCLYAAFVRGLTGELARMMTGARKGHAVLGLRKNNSSRYASRFWDQKPFTRVLSGWGREYMALKKYLHMNNCETILNMSRKGARSMLAQIAQFVREGPLIATGFA